MSRVLSIVFFFAAAVELLAALAYIIPSAQSKLFGISAEGEVAEVSGPYMRADFTTQAGEPCRALIRSEMMFPHGHAVGDRVRLLYTETHPEWAAEDSLRALFGVPAVYGMGALIFGYLGWGFLRRSRRARLTRG